MTNKEQSAEIATKFENIFRCPLCKSPMRVVGLKSLMCSKNHTFDFAKQGYVNMMTRTSTSRYDKKLFEERHKINMDSDLYTTLHKKLSEIIKEYRNIFIDQIMILDAGCGEGSHLQRILDECQNEAMTGIGLDISKEGILMAARNYKESIWLVGDLANSPVADKACHVIINILSPANYMDFKRILVPNGLVIKVVPRANYLKEIREALFADTDKEIYQNDETVSLFKKHFQLVNNFHLSYTKELKSAELSSLVEMSPLAWSSKKEHMDKFINQDSSKVTIDLDILVGVNKQID
ncbi:putative RNA methyltransferase [Oceanobacillus rekensis]|uniref:putative RNA methyltransferase n=1 Tax=Oceanobacillus rekensis TaxID=937927 RepID=UPI000B4338B3|nr:methyltransferase domain-containing protein [Oceanobacillus rekensis]